MAAKPEQFPGDILAELRITTPIAEQYTEAMGRYDFWGIALANQTHKYATDAERELAIAEHHKAEMEVFALGSQIERLDELAA